ncbi:MAG: hypothetical protein QOF77_958 [Solirubrobacteraceae bacterium]|nr:hypothetical protein [Solirubrobacteraceae bacterium]
MTAFVPTELRRCAACKKDYVTALVTEQQDGELTIWEEPCPYCRTEPAAAAGHREMGAAGSR